jgi:hypothetical protein
MTRGLFYLGKAIYLVFFAAGFLIVGAAVAALAETDVDTNASATSDAVRIFFMLCPS